MKTGLFLVVLAAFCIAGKPVSIHARAIDSLGQPLPDAIVYIESFRGNGEAIDFCWGISDSSGKVMSTDGESMALRCPGRCGLAIALIFDERVAECFFDRLGHYTRNELVLSPRTLPGEWNPRTELLSFPFTDEKRLQKRLNEKKNRPLVDAFCKAYEPVLQGKAHLTTGYERKATDIRKLKHALLRSIGN